MTPKEFIEDFRKDAFGLDSSGKLSMPAHARESFEASLSALSKDIYSDDSHFIYELIQNAQDNPYGDGESACLKFILLNEDPTNTEGAEGCLCIINNEQGFSEKDVRSICAAGKSTKKKLIKKEGLIGEKGIGFKSVFKVSSSPHIFSNGFQFFLKENDSVTGLGYIIPYWIENIPLEIAGELNNTCILLPIKRGKFTQIRCALLEHKGEVALFLNKLQRIEIDIPNEQYIASFNKTVDKSGMTYIENTVNGESEIHCFVISSKVVTVPEHINEEKRESVNQRTISVAYPLIKYDALTVFGYLPTKMKSGLPFLINADFLLAANRESINDTQWNDWLLEEIGNFVSDDLVAQIKGGVLGKQGYQFVPIVKDAEVVNERFAKVAESIVDKLKSSEVVLGADAKWYQGNKTRVLTKEFRELFCKAEQLTDVVWVDEEIDKYSKSLQSIDVKHLSNSERKHFLTQSTWIASQSSAWFEEYYSYLATDNVHTKHLFESLPLLPTETSGIFSIKSGKVFLPIAETDYQLPKGLFFPEPLIFRRSLLDRATANKALWEFIETYLKLKPFSHEYYFFNSVYDQVVHHYETADLEQKKQIVNYIIANWQDLNFKERNFSGESAIPILLQDGSLLIVNDERQLLVPKQSANVVSWDKVFTAAEEIAGLTILHPLYNQFSEEQINGYFDALDVKDWPDLQTVEVRETSSIGGHYNEYDEYLNKEFFDNYNQYNSSEIKSGKVQLLPKVFWSISDQSSVTRRSLISYFDHLFQSSCLNKSTYCEYFYYSRKHTTLCSPLVWYLSREAWLKTTQGFKSPSECFVNDPNLKHIFGSHIPYLTDELPETLLESLGIAKDASTETIIGYLETLSENKDKPEIETIAAIYEALDKNNEDVCENFYAKAIIYVPNVGWCLSSEVIWDDVSDISEDIFKSLQAHYSMKLKIFFIEKLNVKESLDSENYANLWLSLQSEAPLNNSKLKLYTKSFARIRREISLPKKPEWFANFKKEVKFYTDKNTWASIHDEPEPFLPDDERLRRAFESKVPFIRRIPDNTYAWMSRLTDNLGLEKFSTVVDYSVHSPIENSLVKTNKYLTDYSRRLICLVIANKTQDGRDYLEQINESGRLKTFFDLQEIVVDHLSIKAEIPYSGISAVLSNECIFLDKKKSIIYINRRSDDDDILDALEVSLLTYLLTGLVRTTEFEDSFIRCLKVTNDASYKKRRDRKGDWVLPNEIRILIEKIIKGRPEHPAFVASLESEKKKRLEYDIALVKPADKTPANGGLTVQDQDNSSSSGEYESHDAEYDIKGDSEDNAHDYVSRSSASSGIGRPDSYSDAIDSSNRSESNNDSRVSSYRGAQSRSKGVTNKVNQARRSQLRSYVASELAEENENCDTEEKQADRSALGEKAELVVLDDLRAKGYKAQRMPINNPGYDIEAVNPKTGEVLYVEVKGDSYAWSDKGVGISKTQYEEANKRKGSYCLAVVDNLGIVPSNPHYITDPVSYITEYRFDSGWLSLSTNIRTLMESSPITVFERLAQLTDSSECKFIVKFCDDNSFPLPEVGLELVGDRGQVILESIELAWETEKIGLFLEPEEKADAAQQVHSWQFFDCSELDSLKKSLEDVFRIRDI